MSLEGSARVGQVVLAAASKHLTPVTLELGGITPFQPLLHSVRVPLITRILFVSRQITRYCRSRM